MAMFSTYKNVVKFGRVVFEIYERRDIGYRETYRHTDTLIAILRTATLPGAK